MFLTYSLRCALYLLGCVLFLVTSSCSKKDDPVPAPTQGRVQGTVLPIGAARTVTLTAANGRTSTTTPDAAGAFAFPDLGPGTYSLSAEPTSSYNPLDPVSLVVQAGETTSVTLTFLRSFRIQGTMSWQQGGVPYTAAVVAGGTGLSFALEGRTAADANGISRSVSIVLGMPGGNNSAPFVGAGFYPLGLSEFTFSMYRYFTTTSLDQYVTGSGGSSVGSVLMSRYDPVALVASGSFEFIAVPVTNGTGNATPTQTITNGRFDITF
ncbi:hypothetical protein GCM10027346_41590 [Hymenobacter seoulensis]